MTGIRRTALSRRWLPATMLVAASFGFPAAGHRVTRFTGAVSDVLATEQRPTYSSRTEIVRVDALVTRNGHPVLGLQPGDFEVRDNGVLQQVDLMSIDRVPLTVIFVFDVSDSVEGQRLVDLRRAAREVLNGLRSDDEAALVTFNASITRACELTAEHGRVASALDQVRTGRGTALVDAVFAGMTLGASETSRVLMIVFSDGLDISSWLAPNSVVRAAKGSDAVAYVVTAGGRELPSFRERAEYEDAVKRVLDSRCFLGDVADVTGGTVFDLDSTRDLEGAFGRILTEFRQRYLISYAPRKVSRDGWHELKVSIKGQREATVRARSGYQAR